ncbi:porin family protein [Dokdonia sp.]|uniref:porin family protein n=1 Tax=Dokdonia sp. TaxID=2024995 RepID=UPI003265D9E3
MRKIILCVVVLFSTQIALSQFFNNNSANGIFDGRFGVTIGVTNYVTDTNLLFSKSGTGFTVGLIGTAEFSDRSSLIMEINYNQHRVKLVGKEDELSPQEDIPFNLVDFSVPIIFNYNYLLLDDFKFGVQAGPSFHLLHSFELVNDSDEGHILEPLLLEPRFLRFDDENEKVSFNIFGAVGLSVEYNEKILAQFRYYRSITDPYRQAPVVSRFVDIEGQDYYFSFTVSYLF